ncbi:hypothetical protein MGR01S_22550 [Meiothermus granaticius NBRC 107808]|uniref:AAA+ ATPase domain-containing protein n=2 Tax=Meiothermus TaxID=65551 RepID=A0A399FEI8_9DEIN|nr:hypothetical protein Mgrana_00637 [Meiothermus granaticius NBRC 107808]GEM87630.1 hypothetical protein MGR01S_22550 [Meiothermus granaticius NBRC 107808]
MFPYSLDPIQYPLMLFPAAHNSPLHELFQADLPTGEPWGWVLAQRILNSAALARRLLHDPLAPGLATWIEAELRALQGELEALKNAHPYGDFGARAPRPAEAAALEVLKRGSAPELQRLYQHFGYGIYASHSAFRYDGSMAPVAHPDPSRFEELVGYTRQLTALRTNVQRFLEGKPTVPMLLYGARGSGKSTSVKALHTHYKAQGLRLVEVSSEGLERLPELLELLGPLPYRFVLYLDDLAFNEGDARSHKLKVLLEGAIYERPANLLVIATSNRRNLLTQSWSDRPEPGSTDPTAWDTLQDKLALADRFGLVLTFPPFDQGHYLEAVRHLLGRELEDELRRAALQFALDGRGFSGRTARHFVNQVV